MNLRLLLGSMLWVTSFAELTYGQKPKTPVVGAPNAERSSSSPPAAISVPSASPSPSISQPPEAKAERSPSIDLARLASGVRPSVIWVTVFDSSGKLLRTETGFFISSDGRIVTTVRAIEGGINAVAKTSDGGIYNISGILAASPTQDLAILQADVKRVSFLSLNTTANLPGDGRVVVVGSGLAGSEGTPREARISTRESNRLEIAAAISANSVGSPLVDANGQVVGIIISPGEKAAVRPSSNIQELLSQIASTTVAKWPETAETRPTPKATPRPRLVYAPAPAFPPESSRPGISGSGRFRLTFDARGNVTNVQMIQSTGNGLFDQAAVNTFRQWKSAPGQEGMLTVPITFRGR